MASHSCNMGKNKNLSFSSHHNLKKHWIGEICNTNSLFVQHWHQVPSFVDKCLVRPGRQACSLAIPHILCICILYPDWRVRVHKASLYFWPTPADIGRDEHYACPHNLRFFILQQDGKFHVIKLQLECWRLLLWMHWMDHHMIWDVIVQFVQSESKHPLTWRCRHNLTFLKVRLADL